MLEMSKAKLTNLSAFFVHVHSYYCILVPMLHNELCQTLSNFSIERLHFIVTNMNCVLFVFACGYIFSRKKCNFSTVMNSDKCGNFIPLMYLRYLHARILHERNVDAWLLRRVLPNFRQRTKQHDWSKTMIDTLILSWAGKVSRMSRRFSVSSHLDHEVLRDFFSPISRKNVNVF